MTPFSTSNPDLKQGFQGLTVYDSHGLYENCFNCVSGRRINVKEAHDYRKFQSALIGTVEFARALESKYGYTGPMKISMASYMNPNVKSKEHPHVWIKIKDPAFWKKIDPSGKQGPKKLAEKPYEEDTVLYLSGDECHKLIYTDSIGFIVKKLENILGYQLDISKDDFFIFMDYENGVFKGGLLATSALPRKPPVSLGIFGYVQTQNP